MKFSIFYTINVRISLNVSISLPNVYDQDTPWYIAIALCRHLFLLYILYIQDVDCVDPAEYAYVRAGYPCHLSCPQDCQYIYYNHQMTFTAFTDSYLKGLASKYGKNESYWAMNAVKVGR